MGVVALAALLAWLCLGATGAPPPEAKSVDLTHFHDTAGKFFVYKYSAVVSVGQNEPTPHASKLYIEGKYLWKKEKEATFYYKFHDIKYTIYNGRDDGELHSEFHALEDAIKDFEKPYVVSYGQDGKVSSIKLQKEEATWSKNMKKSMATSQQVQTFNISGPLKMYQVNEESIHGDCTVDYVVYTKNRNGNDVHYVRKSFEPRTCSNYVQFAVNDAKTLACEMQPEEDLVTSATRFFEIGDEHVFKKFSSHEKLSYLPWSHRAAGVQFIETNQTLVLERLADASEFQFPSVDFEKVSETQDFTFDKNEYIPNVSTAEEIQFGRRLLKQSDLMAKVKQNLLLMIDYLTENRIETEDPKPELKNVLDELYHLISYLKAEALHQFYKSFNKDSEKGQLTMKMFLKMVPHVGTHAAWEFTMQILSDVESYPGEEDAMYMLNNLPMFILDPTEEFAMEMRQLMKLNGEHITGSVQKAAILCYSILLNKVYKNSGAKASEFVKKEVEYFNNRVSNSNTYHDKIVYLMAMRNVEIEEIQKYLIPLIRGEYNFYVKVDIDKPEKYRIAAMWAVARTLHKDKDMTYNVFWPILSNSSEPLTVRITAYEHLIAKNPNVDMRVLMNLHWLMLAERDEHLYNYHYTTVRNVAETTDPCMKNISEMMRKILRLSKRRQNLSSTLSSTNMNDFYDTQYGHGRTYKLAAAIDEASGIPQTGFYEETFTFARKPKLAKGFYWNIDGFNLYTFMNLMKDLGDFNIDMNSIMESLKIKDKNVIELLHKTHGYEIVDMNIHVEFWTLDRGYVTGVEVLFEEGLNQIVKRFADSYKLENLLVVQKKFHKIWLDISFFNHYKMVVATDLGLPALFHNDVPYMSYVKVKPTINTGKVITMNLEFDARVHQHGIYTMKVYNPFADVTHSVQRRSTLDAAFPIDMTLSYNIENQNLKVVLPRMPETSHSVAGIKFYGVDEVLVSRDPTNVLTEHCPSCHHVIEVTQGPTFKNQIEEVVHSKDTGLQYQYNLYDCEVDQLTASTLSEEWFRIYDTDVNNYDKDVISKYVMAFDQGLFNFLSNPYATTCGLVVKTSPSTLYPTSQVEMNWKFDMVNTHPQRIFVNVKGSIESKSHPDNEVMRHWDINMILNITEYHHTFNSTFFRKTPGEENLNICFNVEKMYPNVTSESVKLVYQTDTKVNFWMGHSDKSECVYDETSVDVAIKGELSSEQKEQMKRNLEFIPCFKDPSNPLILNPASRFDWNCLHEAIRKVSLRNYTVDVTYANIPREILIELIVLDDYFRFENYPRITYRPEHTEEGKLKLNFIFPTDGVFRTVTVQSPHYTYEVMEEIYGPEIKTEDVFLDNIIFSPMFLADFYKGDIRPCIAHANDIITDLNKTVPMDLKDWTLMYGDHDFMSYAIFVKAFPENKVAFKIYVHDLNLEIQPGDVKPVFITDGQKIEIDDFDQLLLWVQENFFPFGLKFSNVNEMLEVELTKFQVKIYYTPYNVIVVPHIILDRNIDGVCGHMGSTNYVQKFPLVLS